MSPGASSCQYSGAHVAPLFAHCTPSLPTHLSHGRSNLSLALGIVYETKVFEAQRPSPLSVRKAEDCEGTTVSQTRRPWSLQVNIVRCSIGAVVLGGALVFATFVSNIRDHGSFENGAHTACCVYHTPSIAGLSAALGISSSLSGVAGMYLSLLAGSNFRALTYVGRAVVVLALQVRRAYCTDNVCAC